MIFDDLECLIKLTGDDNARIEVLIDLHGETDGPKTYDTVYCWKTSSGESHRFCGSSLSPKDDDAKSWILQNIIKYMAELH